MSHPVITLTTDFGYTDPFVGVIKGVIAKINPDACPIDITHGIRQYDIREAAFAIGMSYAYFPAKSIHIVVVDPGVGSGRRPVMVITDRQYFIGPDNGVFSSVYAKEQSVEVIHITSGHYFLAADSPTFQARDVFAPVAAYLSKGISTAKFGEVITDYFTILLPRPEKKGSWLVGEVIHIDRFGNAITNIEARDLTCHGRPSAGSNIKILFRGQDIPLKKFYAESGTDSLCGVLNSSGYLELFVSRGNAAGKFGISPGEKAEIFFAEYNSLS